MKIVYMGTPDFAVGPLEALIAAGHTVTAVVTQPDKAKGRSKKLIETPVKVCAMKYDIPVFQPVKIKAPEAVEILKSYEADIYVVAAFGQILSQEILDIPRYGCLCIHASLLPAYRGAAPINWAILNGEKETGVTIMQMDAGIDTGDMLLKAAVEIEEQDTDVSLFDKLEKAGSRLIVEALQKLEKGELVPIKQDDAQSSYARMLNKAMGEIDWNESAAVIDRKVRGLYSWPGAYTFYQGKMLKIWQAKPVLSAVQENSEKTPAEAACENETAQPGCVYQVTKDSVEICTGEGRLKLLEVQLEGKKRMAVKDFLLGCKMGKGEKLG
ncbi:MAG: methionyl-tRNA formyltransferase [Lachnospiraceae bacterium]|nr:methionyl-tRNA formyltransferase [Lachnospiraceae bacterium]